MSVSVVHRSRRSGFFTTRPKEVTTGLGESAGLTAQGECLFTMFGGSHASYSESLPVSGSCSSSGTRFALSFVRLRCFLLRLSRCLLLNSTV